MSAGRSKKRLFDEQIEGESDRMDGSDEQLANFTSHSRAGMESPLSPPPPIDLAEKDRISPTPQKHSQVRRPTPASI